MDHYWFLRAYGKFNNSEDGTIIEIVFKNPHRTLIDSLLIKNRCKYDQKRILEFLCVVLNLNVIQLNEEMLDSGIKLSINSNEETFVYNKSGNPESDIEEFKAKQEEICSNLADLVIEYIPEHWSKAIFEISIKKEEFEFSFYNSNNEKEHFASSDNILEAARELKIFYQDYGKEWNKVILALSWDSKSKGWHMSVDCHF